MNFNNLQSRMLFVATFICTTLTSFSQSNKEHVSSIIVNGGIFEFSPPYTDYVTVTMQDRLTKSSVIVDTIFTQSAQDIYVDSNAVFIAAGDSIVKYNLDMERLKSTPFGAQSTIKLAVYKDLLIAGNWYGSSNNNLRIFDKNSMTFIDSISELKYAAKDFVVSGDSLFVQQNLTNSFYEDSAGFISVIDLSKLSFVRNIQLSNSGFELGRMLLYGDSIIALNQISNSITTYHISSGLNVTNTVNFDIETNYYGQQFYQHNDSLYLLADNGLFVFDLNSFQLSSSPIIDSVYSFSYNPNDRVFVATFTDFASYSWGANFDSDGMLLDSIEVGYAPECIGLIYNSTTDVLELTNKDFSFFPNPCIDEVQLKFDGSANRELIIYGLSGTEMRKMTLNSELEQIQLSDLPIGIYFLEIREGDQRMIQKLVKK